MKQKWIVVAKYFLVFTVFSFLGWLWETVYIWVATGVIYDRGFMRLPFCPIYGSGVMASYFLMGTPQQPRGILKNVVGSYRRYVLYLLLAFAVPTLVEYAIGFFFDKAFSVRLWNYEGRPLNVNGYICFLVSVVWAVALTLVMRFVFPFIKKNVFRIPDKVTGVLAVVLLIAFTVDTAHVFSRQVALLATLF